MLHLVKYHLVLYYCVCFKLFRPYLVIVITILFSLPFIPWCSIDLLLCFTLNLVLVCIKYTSKIQARCPASYVAEFPLLVSLILTNNLAPPLIHLCRVKSPRFGPCNTRSKKFTLLLVFRKLYQGHHQLCFNYGLFYSLL